MPNPTQLVRQGGPIEERVAIAGFVATTRPAPTTYTEGVWVVAPGYSQTALIGPCKWGQVHGSTKPAQGAAVLVVFDDKNEPRVVWWEGEFAGGGGGKEPGEIKLSELKTGFHKLSEVEERNLSVLTERKLSSLESPKLSELSSPKLSELTAAKLSELETRKHSELEGLVAPADDHTQYALLAGRTTSMEEGKAVGQLLYGGHYEGGLTPVLQLQGNNPEGLAVPAVGVVQIGGTVPKTGGVQWWESQQALEVTGSASLSPPGSTAAKLTVSGAAPAAAETAENAQTTLNVLGIAGGATTSTTGKGGTGSKVFITTGAGGAGTQFGGSGAAGELSGGKGGAIKGSLNSVTEARAGAGGEYVLHGGEGGLAEGEAKELEGGGGGGMTGFGGAGGTSRATYPQSSAVSVKLSVELAIGTKVAEVEESEVANLPTIVPFTVQIESAEGPESFTVESVSGVKLALSVNAAKAHPAGSIVRYAGALTPLQESVKAGVGASFLFTAGEGGVFSTTTANWPAIYGIGGKGGPLTFRGGYSRDMSIAGGTLTFTGGYGSATGDESFREVAVAAGTTLTGITPHRNLIVGASVEGAGIPGGLSTTLTSVAALVSKSEATTSLWMEAVAVKVKTELKKNGTVLTIEENEKESYTASTVAGSKRLTGLSGTFGIFKNAKVTGTGVPTLITVSNVEGLGSSELEVSGSVSGLFEATTNGTALLKGVTSFTGVAVGQELKDPSGKLGIAGKTISELKAGTKEIKMSSAASATEATPQKVESFPVGAYTFTTNEVYNKFPGPGGPTQVFPFTVEVAGSEGAETFTVVARSTNKLTLASMATKNHAAKENATLKKQIAIFKAKGPGGPVKFRVCWGQGEAAEHTLLELSPGTEAGKEAIGMYGVTPTARFGKIAAVTNPGTFKAGTHGFETEAEAKAVIEKIESNVTAINALRESLYKIGVTTE